MALEVIVRNKGIPEIMDIVNELRDQGIKQHIDFDFAYKPPAWNNFSFETIQEKHAVFTFYKEKYATWFAIKYGS